jgi:hypothetical protein
MEDTVLHIQCDKLLRILRRFHPELPKSTSRPTLVQTDRNKVQLLEAPPGYYKHFGIKNGLFEVFDKLSDRRTIPELIFLLVLTTLIFTTVQRGSSRQLLVSFPYSQIFLRKRLSFIYILKQKCLTYC